MTVLWRSVFASALLLLAVGLVLRSSEVVIVALPYLVVALRPLFARGVVPAVSVSCSIEPPVLYEGGSCLVAMTLINPSRSAVNVEILRHPVPGSVVANGRNTRFRIAGGAAHHGSYAPALGRGLWPLGGVRMVLAGDGGLVEREVALEMEGSITVLPRVERVPRIDLHAVRRHGPAGLAVSRSAGEGTDFAGTRPYLRGDSLRRLNWKALARGRGAITNVYDRLERADVVLVLDVRANNNVVVGNDSLFEDCVRAAASLSRMFLSSGSRLTVVLYGGAIDWLPPGYGTRHSARALALFARAQLRDHVAFRDFANLPKRVFPIQAHVVIVSSLAEREELEPLRILSASGYRITVLSPDPIAFERNRRPPVGPHGALAERVVRLRRSQSIAELRASGIEVVSWDSSRPLQAALLGRRRP